MFTTDQAFVFFVLLWAVIITWPKMASSLGKVLYIHSVALSIFYDYLWLGIRMYWGCWLESKNEEFCSVQVERK